MQIYVINLDDRKDRLEYITAECKKLGLDFKRFSAIKHQNPIIGCALSHFTLLESLAGNAEPILILEDDCKFVDDAKDAWIKSFFELPNDWSMWYWGANICGKISRVATHVGRLSHAQSTHCYCVNPTFIPTLLNQKDKIGQHLDLIYTNNIIPNYPCYITIPMLAVQRESYSDIENKVVNYESWMLDRYWSNLCH